MRALSVAGLAAFAIHSIVSCAFAELPEDERPSVCSGYATFRRDDVTPGADKPGRAVLCPPGHAYMGVSESPAGPQREGRFVSVDGGDCCPVPAALLTDTHSWEYEQCPENSVATGSRLTETVEEINRSVSQMRCTKINTDRFVLAASEPGEKYGIFESQVWATVFGIPEVKTSRPQLPLALRYGLGRRAPSSWRTSGCVGRPPGSLLVAKRGKYCEDLRYSTVRHRDPTKPDGIGSELKLLPDCVSIDDIQSLQPRCLAAPSDEEHR